MNRRHVFVWLVLVLLTAGGCSVPALTPGAVLRPVLPSPSKAHAFEAGMGGGYITGSKFGMAPASIGSGQAWAGYTRTFKSQSVFSIGGIAAVGEMSESIDCCGPLALGLYVRYLQAFGSRFSIGVDGEVGVLWASAGIPVVLQVLKSGSQRTGLGIYATPAVVGNMNSAFLRLPYGVNLSLADSVQIAIEGTYWADIERGDSWMGVGLSVSFRFGKTRKVEAKAPVSVPAPTPKAL